MLRLLNTINEVSSQSQLEFVIQDEFLVAQLRRRCKQGPTQSFTDSRHPTSLSSHIELAISFFQSLPWMKDLVEEVSEPPLGPVTCKKQISCPAYLSQDLAGTKSFSPPSSYVALSRAAGDRYSNSCWERRFGLDRESPFPKKNLWTKQGQMQAIHDLTGICHRKIQLMNA